MSSQSSQELRDSLRERIDLIAYIGQSVDLRKQGKSWLGCCPFHTEKTPSFSVDGNKGVFYCFGCQAGGDIFSFVMLRDGCSFPQAMQALAEYAGIATTDPKDPKHQAQREQQRLSAQMTKAQQFFADQLCNTSARQAQQYLKTRGIGKKEAQTWGLGYGGQPGALLQWAQNTDFPEEDLFALGLVQKSDHSPKPHELFAHRLIFPIQNAQGDPIALGGRALNAQNTAKYINSPETELFKKNEVLFGWPQAMPEIRRSQTAILVEGYMDTLACHRAGHTHTIAALGTRLSLHQAQRIARLSKKVILMLDGDAAGIRAAQKAAIILWQCRLQVLVAVLEKGQDPDDLFRKGGPAALTQVLGQSLPAMNFFMDQHLSDAGQSIDGQVEAVRAMAPLFASISDPLAQELYQHRLAQALGLPPATVQEHLKKSIAQAQAAASLKAQTAKAQTSKPSSSKPSEQINQVPHIHTHTPSQGIHPLEKAILKEMLLFPELSQRCGELADFALTTTMASLWDRLAEMPKDASPEKRQHLICEHLGEAVFTTLAPRKNAPSSQEAQLQTGKAAKRTFDDALKRLKLQHMEIALATLQKAIGEHDTLGALNEDVLPLLRKKRDLIQKRNALKSS